MPEKASSIFSSWIFDSYHYSLEGLALYRIFSALFLLFFMLPSLTTYRFLSSLPDDFYSPPPGPMMLFNGFPPSWVFMILHGLLVVSLLFLLAGFGTRIASVATGLLFLVIKGFIYSTGKINHDLVLIIIPLVMSCSEWGQAYSIDFYRQKTSETTAQNWTISLVALILGFMMFTAGFPKITGGWLNIYTHATQGHFFNQYFVHSRQDLLAPFALHIPGGVWELLDYATVFLEVAFLAAIFHPKSTRLFICMAVCFHFCTMMVLNISFLPNFLAYAAFINWPWINHKLKTYEPWMPPIAIAAGMILLFVLIRFLSHYLKFQSGLTTAAVCIISLTLPVAFYGIFGLVKELMYHKNQKEELPSS